MSDTVIKVEHLSKEYRLGTISHGTLYRDLQSWIARILGRDDPNTKISCSPRQRQNERFKALDDISLDVERGDVMGVIGRNGAGKSTLLKIISRVTAPTQGKVSIKGRVASLLEVGTGFHPELTGRENVYLNGSILGMRKHEIDRKFEEIIEFAEISKFIDTPVKRYSSGMYVRLAFAVAAHLEPEILIVDEVLSVGDAAFQKKALGKMEDVSKGQGRTVLFVSHNMGTISNLCKRSILIENGSIIKDGKTDDIISSYITRNLSGFIIPLNNRIDRKGDGRLRFTETWIEDENGNKVTTVISGKSMKIAAIFEIKDNEIISNISVAFGIYTMMGVKITDLSNLITGDYFEGTFINSGKVECVIPRVSFNSGCYTYNVIARVSDVIEDWIIGAGSFDVESGDYFGTGRVVSAEHGSILVDHEWKIIVNNNEV